ncbi:hypothetical protein L1987_59147 [Smallanthus sonchifolius]|uniref:Uncharacterized protein n=1 Tax=Smallanthus sonchifolius TaxID=185202 RepID=A0ACB9D4E4_9ASTR|nr:hypothetical protein L1987_59147 [Smallanthus sonchifolius]
MSGYWVDMRIAIREVLSRPFCRDGVKETRTNNQERERKRRQYPENEREKENHVPSNHGVTVENIELEVPTINDVGNGHLEEPMQDEHNTMQGGEVVNENQQGAKIGIVTVSLNHELNRTKHQRFLFDSHQIFSSINFQINFYNCITSCSRCL